MNKTKLIKKLLKKAEVLEGMNFDENKMKPVELQELAQHKGELYYFNNCFYLRSEGGEWLKSSVKEGEPKKKELAPKSQNKDIDIAYLTEWLNNITNYVEREILLIKKDQATIFAELKQYIDNSVNSLQK